MNKRSTSKRKRSGTHSSASGGSTVIGASLIGTAVGMGLITVLTVILSGLCLASSDPNTLLIPFSLGINAVSFFFAGFTGAKRKSAAIPVGALSGAILASLLWIFSLFLGNAATWGFSLPVELLIRCSFIIPSVLGGLLAVNSKVKKRK